MADWDERYRRGEHSSEKPYHLLLKAVETLQPGSALDIACGAGRHAVFLAERGWKVTAVDISQAAIEKAAIRAGDRGLEIDLRKADLEKDDFKIERETYDLVCNFFYLQRDLFPRIRDGIRVGGVFTAAIHMVDESPDIKPMNPLFLLKPEQLLREFDGWKILHYSESRPDTLERMRAEIIALKT